MINIGPDVIICGDGDEKMPSCMASQKKSQKVIISGKLCSYDRTIACSN